MPKYVNKKSDEATVNNNEIYLCEKYKAGESPTKKNS